MPKLGLVSISFRKETPETILRAAFSAGLSCIEWGSDIHAPCTDLQQIQQIALLQKQYGIRCCSYGTYFRLGETPLSDLPDYIAAAKQLGTDILRLWCGGKRADDYSMRGKEHLFSQCRQAAAMAEEAGVMLCIECHIKSYTETAEGSLELMRAVNSPAFRMYWQPNQFRTIEENIYFARTLRTYITHIHVFQWKGKERFSLATGTEEWRRYLAEIPGMHTLLLEFMPDDRIDSLVAEANALRRIAGGNQ